MGASCSSAAVQAQVQPPEQCSAIAQQLQETPQLSLQPTDRAATDHESLPESGIPTATTAAQPTAEGTSSSRPNGSSSGAADCEPCSELSKTAAPEGTPAAVLEPLAPAAPPRTVPVAAAPPVPGTPRGPPLQTLVSTPARVPIDVTLRGVKLSYLMDLARSIDDTMTVAEVVEKVVRPQTQEYRCCFFDVVPLQHTGQPTYFVSHTWSRKMCDLMVTLATHFGLEYNPSSGADSTAEAAQATQAALQSMAQEDGGEPPVVWLDIIAINQWPYVDEKGLLNDDVANLAKVIGSTQQTLFCLDARGVVLTRIWCLFEVWHTVLAGGAQKLLVLANQVDKDALKEVYLVVDVEQAQATLDADRVRILSEISASLGFHQLNMAIKKALVDATRHEADQAHARILAGDSQPQSGEGASQGRRAMGPKEQAAFAILNKHINMLQVAGIHKEAQRYGHMMAAVSERFSQASPAPRPSTAGGASDGPRDPSLAGKLRQATALQLKGDADNARLLLSAAAEEAEARLKGLQLAATPGTEPLAPEVTAAAGDALYCLYRLYSGLKDQGRLDESVDAAGRALGIMDRVWPGSGQGRGEASEHQALRASVLYHKGAVLWQVPMKMSDAAESLKEALLTLGVDVDAASAGGTSDTLGGPAATAAARQAAQAAAAGMPTGLPAPPLACGWPAIRAVEGVEKLAQVSVFTGDGVGGRQLWRVAGALRSMLGEEDAALSAESQLATLLIQSKEYEEAEETFRAVIDRKLAKGGTHSMTVVAEWTQLAQVLAETGRVPEAVQLHQRIAELYRSNPTTAETTMPLPGLGTVRMVDAYEDGHMLAMQVPAAAPAIKRYVATRGDDPTAFDPVAAAAVAAQIADEDIASVSDRAYKAWGEQRLEEAERLLRLRITLIQESLGFVHKDTVAAYTLLGQFLSSMSRYTEAEQQLRLAVAAGEQMLGGRDPDLGDTLVQLADAVAATEGQEQEASALRQRALQLFVQVLGEEHPRTAGCKLRVAAESMSEAARQGDMVALEVAKKHLEEAQELLQRES